MKMIPFLFALALMVGLSDPALAAKKKTHHSPQATGDEAGTVDEKDEDSQHGTDARRAGAESESAQKPPLDFDFFGGQAGAAADGKGGGELVTPPSELAEAASTRRWMLTTHQILGVSTWLSLAALVTVGQLNYNQLYGGGGGSNKWQPYHRGLVISTSVLFTATATFAILAPTPYKKPLRFDTGLVHRIAVIGATLGMLTEGFLGWWTTHQADAGNPHNLRTMARTHQIVGYTTLGFLTVAGTVWLF